MSSPEPDRAGASNAGRGLATVASLIVGTAFLALWFWLLPSWLEFRAGTAAVMPWRWLAAIPAVVGFTLALNCIWDFGRHGRGTPAPFAPPQRLVVTGWYRYVRNPMYLGFFLGWLGLWAVFGRASLSALAVALGMVLIAILFVRFYEEPALRRMFGADYDEYCRNVPRWLPRPRPWQP